MAVHLPARRAVLTLFFASLSVALSFAVSCGGLTEQDPSDLPAKPDASGGGGSAGAGGSKDAGLDAKPPKKDAGKDASSDAKTDVQDALPDYVDPGCPDAGPPITQYECDPYGDECGPGKSCYPFIETPENPCEQEVYGATCIFAGSAGQGEPCGLGCQAGHVCVISGQGTQCVLMCNLNEPNPCKGGLVCVAVDIPGIGGCI